MSLRADAARSRKNIGDAAAKPRPLTPCARASVIHARRAAGRDIINHTTTVRCGRNGAHLVVRHGADCAVAHRGDLNTCDRRGARAGQRRRGVERGAIGGAAHSALVAVLASWPVFYGGAAASTASCRGRGGRGADTGQRGGGGPHAQDAFPQEWWRCAARASVCDFFADGA